MFSTWVEVMVLGSGLDGRDVKNAMMEKLAKSERKLRDLFKPRAIGVRIK